MGQKVRRQRARRNSMEHLHLSGDMKKNIHEGGRRTHERKREWNSSLNAMEAAGERISGRKEADQQQCPKMQRC